MNTPFWHILWKEYRAVRGFWVGLAVLGVLWQWLLTAVMAPGLDLSASVYATPLVASALFVTGCLAAVFAAEREEETLGFLQILPTTSWTVARGKLTFAGLSTFLLAAFLASTAVLAAGQWTDPALATLVAVFGVAVVECAAWAALFSLLWQRPLLVAIAAIAAASVATHVAIGVANPTPVPAWSLATYAGAWEARLALAVVVALAAGLVARRWMDGGSFGERVATWWRRMDARRRSATETQEVAAAPPRPSAFPIIGRLLWQTWRQSWRVALVFLLLGPPIVGFLTYSASLASDTLSTPWWIGLSAVLGGLFGTLVYHADQEGGRYRFFAERGERPGLVWFARLVFWGTALVLMTLIIHLAAAYGLVRDPLDQILNAVQSHFRRREMFPRELVAFHLEDALVYMRESWSLLLVVGFSVLVHAGGFCIGQLCSMAIKSGVIAGFAASLVTVVFVVWAAVLVAWELEGLLAWTLVVIPLSLLLATRLRARSWLLQRGGWRGWMWPVGVVAVPAVLVVVSIPSLRTQLPVPVYSGGDLAMRQDMFQEARASYENSLAAAAEEGSETADLYLRACDLLESTDSFSRNAGVPEISIEVEHGTQEDQHVREWIEQNAAALELALDAAARETCIFPADVVENDRRLGQLSMLQLLVNASGGALARAGGLDEALDRHLAALTMTEHFLQFQRTPMRLKFGRTPTYNWITAWARQDGQTPERLKQAIEAIDSRPVVAPPLGESLLADYFHLRSILLGEKDPSAGGLNVGDARMRLAYLAHQLPWERERALAVLDRVYTEMYFAASAVDESFAEGVTSRILFRYSPASPLPPDSVLRTTYYLLALYSRLPDFGYLAEQIAADEFYRRALLVKLALAAYRLEHGNYPKLLAQLVGDYLGQLPTDNLALEKRTFYYHPEGLDAPLQDGSYRGLSDPPPPIPAATPLFWSPKEGHAVLGDSPRPRLLKSVQPPFYELPRGADVFVLPRDDATEEDDPQGRPPEKDDVPFERIDTGYGGGYDGGYGGGYGGAGGGYGSGYDGGYGMDPSAAGSATSEPDNVPPDQDPPPVE